MSRPPKMESERFGKVVSVCIDPALEEQIERHRGRLQSMVPSAIMTKSDALRDLIVKGASIQANAA